MLKSIEENEIVATAAIPHSYVDDLFFEESIGETSSNEITYSIKFKSIRVDYILNSGAEDAGLAFLKNMLRLKKMSLFDTSYMDLLIQFLFKHYSKKIMRTLLPFYLLQLLSMLAFIFVTERRWENNLLSIEMGADELGVVDTSEDSQVARDFSKLAGVNGLLNFLMTVSTVVNFGFFFFQIVHLRMDVIRRMWGYVDALVIILNTTIIFDELFTDSIETKPMRIIEATLMLLLWFKSLYFLSLMSEIAPLIDMIFSILDAMKYFLMVYVICLLAFCNAYYLVGKNQVDSGNEQVTYSTLFNSIFHVYKSSLGDFSTGSYFIDDQWVFMVVLYLGVSVFMLILLMNMLIALMGETFSQN